MSDEYRELEGRLKRMAVRKERAINVINELQSLVAELDTDMQAAQLQLDALRYEGDRGE